jgi:hypothetical protein
MFDDLTPSIQGERGPLWRENMGVFGACSPGCLSRAQSQLCVLVVLRHAFSARCLGAGAV